MWLCYYVTCIMIIKLTTYEDMCNFNKRLAQVIVTDEWMNGIVVRAITLPFSTTLFVVGSIQHYVIYVQIVVLNLLCTNCCSKSKYSSSPFHVCLKVSRTVNKHIGKQLDFKMDLRFGVSNLAIPLCS